MNISSDKRSEKMTEMSQLIEKDQENSGFRNQRYMSTSTFLTMAEEIRKQKQTAAHLSRSASIGIDMAPSALNPIKEGQRRALYGSLPFVAAFGMNKRESEIKKVLSRVSLQSMIDASKANEYTASLSEVDVDEIIVTFPLIMATLVAVVTQFLVGYNTSVMNAPSAVVFPDHTTTQWSIAVSAFAIGGPLGAIAGGIMANKRGRRGTIITTSWIFLLGGVMMSLAPNVLWLIPARLIIGFASGVSSVVVPVYLGEIAPPTLRGTLGTCTQFALVTGILASAVLAYPFGTETRWRYLFGITPLLCIIQLIVSPLMLESPRWLLTHNELCTDARIAIKALRGFRSDDEVEEEVKHFMFAAMKHKLSARESAHSTGAMLDLLRDRKTRVLLISCIFLQMAQQLCGINAVFYYSSMFFAGFIENPLNGTVLICLVNVIATYIALKLMDSTGRKTLLLWSAGGMLVSTLFIISALLGMLPNYIALLSVMAFVSFFEIGLGPIPWLIVAEMFDAKYVATAMSLSCIVNWACNFLVGLCFPFMNLYMGPYSFAPFALVLIIVLFYTVIMLPETHGRTVEEIQRLSGSDDDEIKKAIEVIAGVSDYNFDNEENMYD